jgi:uncharacterized protein
MAIIYPRSMAQLTDTLDLARMRLLAGEGRRLDLAVHLEPFAFGEDSYDVVPDPFEVRLDISKTTHEGHALRMRFTAGLSGPCMRCLEPAEPQVEVDAREVDQPGGGEDLESPYVTDDVIDVSRWARDALALALPAQLLCREDCAGLCPQCGANLNEAGPEHHHDKAPDPRWAALSQIKFDN